jgi:hypothetical protein
MSTYLNDLKKILFWPIHQFFIFHLATKNKKINKINATHTKDFCEKNHLCHRKKIVKLTYLDNRFQSGFFFNFLVSKIWQSFPNLFITTLCKLAQKNKKKNFCFQQVIKILQFFKKTFTSLSDL